MNFINVAYYIVRENISHHNYHSKQSIYVTALINCHALLGKCAFISFFLIEMYLFLCINYLFYVLIIYMCCTNY